MVAVVVVEGGTSFDPGFGISGSDGGSGANGLIVISYEPNVPIDSWHHRLNEPPPPRESLGAPSQSFFFYVADLASIAFSAALNGFRGWFAPLGEPVRIPPRLETGSQQFYLPPNQPIFRRSKAIDGSHDGTPLLHGLHDKTSQIAIKVNS